MVKGIDATLADATANQLLANNIRVNVSNFDQQIQTVINNVSTLTFHFRYES